MENKVQIGGVMRGDGLTLISTLAIPSRPGTAGKIMSAMGDNDLNVEFITQTVGLAAKDHIIFCVKKEIANQTMMLLNGLKAEIGAEKIARQDDVGLVFAFGPDFRYSSGIAGQVFKVLGREGINIIAISSSVSTISCVIDADRVDDAVNALEKIFIIP